MDSSIGRFFRPPLRRRRKMAALPLPVAILDDLISGSRKWGHPRWRPEAEGPPFSSASAIGVEKPAPGPGWRHFRRSHLGSKMVTVEMTYGGRRDAREDVLQTSAPSMSPVEVWIFLDLKSIWSLASPRHYPSDWVSCPLATTGKSISLHVPTPWNMVLTSASTYSTFFYFIFIFFNCTLQQPRIVVQYSVIVGRNLETNLTPTMTIFWFSSILSTKRPWRSSSRMSCICTIRMLPNLPRSRIAPWLPLRRQNPERTRSKATMGRWLYPWSIEGL